MTFRFIFRTILASSALTALAIGSNDAAPDPPKRSPTDRPNFVLLFMDDLGYGDMGFTGHPTTKTPNLDRLAWDGMVLTTFYSACSACTGSRAGLMTGRQWPRTGLPNVLTATGSAGLNLNETTIAEHLKLAGYSTGIVGKWHLGQRKMYLPGNRGFDSYLGIPYSDDMGDAIASECPSDDRPSNGNRPPNDLTAERKRELDELYRRKGMSDNNDDPARYHLPLIHQEKNQTTIVEQPLDFTTLALKYNKFATDFIRKEGQGDNPFFLYVPFSHVHVTSGSQKGNQYAGCNFQNSTRRGKFGDALAEADWIVGNIHQTLKDMNLENNTLILFTSDNGPWLSRGLTAGSAGIFTGRYAGYYDTGKHTTWEGGIRMPAFAHWAGQIRPHSRSVEIASSLDVFPTFSGLAGIPLPADRPYDGKDLTPVLFGGPSKHKDNFLFFYDDCHIDEPYYTVTAVRHGKYKAHWCTAPGNGQQDRRAMIKVYDKYPLLFDVEKDPSESIPISEGDLPDNPAHREAMDRIMKAYAMEKATFVFGKVVHYPDEPGEGPGRYGVCCDRSMACNCAQNSSQASLESSFFNLWSLSEANAHHQRYHQYLGEDEPSPPRTRVQRRLQTAKT